MNYIRLHSNIFWNVITDPGKAAALAVAKSLVSDNVPKYIGVQPYVVHEKQLKRAWKDIFFEALPEELGEKQMGQ